MDNLEMFKSNFSVDDNTIIDELKKCNTGELLPEESSGRFFSEAIEFEGQFVFLNKDDRYIICYCDNEISIDSIDLDNSKFSINSEHDRTIFTLINLDKNIQNNLTMIFKNNNRDNMDILNNIKQTKKVEIYFLSIIFGGFAKEKHKIFELSDNDVKNIIL